MGVRVNCYCAVLLDFCMQLICSTSKAFLPNLPRSSFDLCPCTSYYKRIDSVLHALQGQRDEGLKNMAHCTKPLRLSSVDASPSRKRLTEQPLSSFHFVACHAEQRPHRSTTLRLSKRGRTKWSAAGYSRKWRAIVQASTHAQDFGTVSGVNPRAVAAFFSVTSHATRSSCCSVSSFLF